MGPGQPVDHASGRASWRRRIGDSWRAGAAAWKRDRPPTSDVLAVLGLVVVPLLLLLVVLLAHDVGPTDVPERPLVVVGVVLAVGLVALAASSFARRTFLLAVAGAGIAVVATLLPVGAEARAEADAETQRARAEDLSEEVAELAGTAADAVPRPATAALAGADRALRRAIDASATSLRTACAGEGLAALEARLCAVSALAHRGLAADPGAEAGAGSGTEEAATLADDLARAGRELQTELAGDGLEPQQQERVTLFATAVAAVAALPDDVAAAAHALAAADGSAAALCRAAGGGGWTARPAGEDPTAQACTGSGTPASARDRAVAEARAELDVLLATPRATGADADEDAVTAAEAALADAEDRSSDGPSVPITDLVADAATDVVAGLPATSDDSVPIDLGPLGWAVVATAALALLRLLALHNGARGPASVTITKVDSVAATAAEGDVLTPAFRRHVLANVREPAAVPGATQTTGVTDILDTSVAADKLLGSVIKALRNVLARSATFAVEATHLETTSGGTSQHEVFVKIVSGRTGSLVTSGAVVERDRDLAVRSAGYWAAAEILARDDTIPSWAGWSGAASRALAIADEARARHRDAVPTAAQVETLRQAAASAPTSGIVLGLYAGALNLTGRHLDALEVELRAVICHPRYPILRYRLIATLSMVAGALDERGLRAEASRWRRLIATLDRVETATGCPVDGPAWSGLAPTPGGTPGVAAIRARLLALADGLAAQATTSVRWEPCLVRAIRRDERAFWLRLVTGSGRSDRRRFRALLRSIGRTVTVRRQTLAGGPATEADRITIAPDAAHGWWQVAYNDACTVALDEKLLVDVGGRDRIDVAVGLLERAVEVDHAGHLSSTWLARDPDLAALRHDERFTHLLATTRAVPPEPDPGGPR